MLEGLTPDSPVRSLVPEEKAGLLCGGPDLSFDAKKIVFCLMPSGEKSFHLYEVNVDPSTTSTSFGQAGSGQAGSGFKQLTFGDYDDLDPIYLPNGKLHVQPHREPTPMSVADRPTILPCSPGAMLTERTST